MLLSGTFSPPSAAEYEMDTTGLYQIDNASTTTTTSSGDVYFVTDVSSNSSVGIYHPWRTIIKETESIARSIRRRRKNIYYYDNADAATSTDNDIFQLQGTFTAPIRYATTYGTANTYEYSEAVDGAFLDYHNHPERDELLKTPEQRLKQIITERMSPAIHTRHKPVQASKDPREVRARETLRMIIGDEKYRQFLKKGYVSATNRKSGNTYQMYPGHEKTRLIKNGRCVETLCVVLKGQFPPTDSLIVRYLMVLNNEEEFLKLAVKWGVSTKSQQKKAPETRSLPAIFNDLRARKSA